MWTNAEQVGINFSLTPLLWTCVRNTFLDDVIQRLVDVCLYELCYLGGDDDELLSAQYTVMGEHRLTSQVIRTIYFWSALELHNNCSTLHTFST